MRGGGETPGCRRRPEEEGEEAVSPQPTEREEKRREGEGEEEGDIEGI